MRFLALILCALVAAPVDAAPKKKKPAAAKKAPKAKPKPAPKPAPEPEPAPKVAEKKSTVLLDTNPAALAYQLEQALSEGFTVGAADTALPDEVDHDAVVKASRKGRAVAVVTARYANGVWVLRTWSGADGGVLAEATFKAPKDGPKAVVPKGALAKLVAAAKKADATAAQGGADETAAGAGTKPAGEKRPPDGAKPKPEPARQQEEEKEQEPEPPAAAEVEPQRDRGPKPQALRIAVGVKPGDRIYTPNDDLFVALSRYRQPLAPRIAFELDFFPGALATSGPASWFGLTASLDFLVFVTAVASDGTRYTTSSLRVTASAMGRIPIIDDRLELGVLFGFALDTYEIGGDAPVPDVSYSALRPGASVALRLFGPVYLRAAGGYHILLGTGQLGSAQYFPRLKGGGMDLEAGAMVRPLRFLELRASFDYRRFWFSFNPEPGDPYIAGGALDDSRGFSVTAAFTY